MSITRVWRSGKGRVSYARNLARTFLVVVEVSKRWMRIIVAGL